MIWFILGAFLGMIWGAMLYRSWLDCCEEQRNEYTLEDGQDNVVKFK